MTSAREADPAFPPSTHGIYAITNTVTGKTYIGCARKTRITARWTTHRWALRSGTHQNPRLQADWDSYGPDAFVIRLLEAISPDESAGHFVEREAFHVAVWPGPLYNIQSVSVRYAGADDKHQWHADAAQRMGLSPRTVSKYIRSGILKGTIVNGRMTVSDEEIDRYVRARRKPGRPVTTIPQPRRFAKLAHQQQFKGNVRFYCHIHPSLIETIDEVRGALTRGEFITMLVTNYKVDQSNALDALDAAQTGGNTKGTGHENL